MPDFSIPPFDERIYAFLREAGLPEDLVDPGQHRSHALAELYVLELVIDLVEQLGMTDLLARPRTAAELLEAREFVPGFRTALCWLLERLVAAAAAARLGAEPACVLEVGAGLGSATEALLELLSARGHVGALTSYRFTEPVPFFRRRAQRTLEAAHPGVPFVFSALDIN